MSTPSRHWWGDRISEAMRAAHAERMQSAGPEWLGLAEVAVLLESTDWVIGRLRKRFPLAVLGRAANGGRSARGVGLLLARADVNRLLAIRRRVPALPLSCAFAVLEAVKAGGPL